MMSTQPMLFDTMQFRTDSKQVRDHGSEWGTFKDSLKAPIHGWFTYPAGFSFKAVEYSLKNAGLKVGKSVVYDPFMGSGTTNLVAKSLGYNSIGVEAHPFVFSITKTKMNWNLDGNELNDAVYFIQSRLEKSEKPAHVTKYLKKEFPELILKCFLPETLFELLFIRDTISKLKVSQEMIDFLRTALICVLRDVSTASTGWPYIAPKKMKITGMSKKGWETYKNRVYKMFSDIMVAQKNAVHEKSRHEIFCGDSRNTGEMIADHSVDHIFTSPPYLNNFDYADRTRLELYFMGEAKNWNDISEHVRKKLMTSATTQINRSDTRYRFLESFCEECPKTHKFLAERVEQLSELRLVKGGKKSYDLMVVGYFNDIFRILKDNVRVLKPGKKALYILGDSAPYGVHIPTDTLIGEIGCAVGFKNYEIEVLRERGGKWEKNPQRHNVKLRESIVTLEK